MLGMLQRLNDIGIERLKLTTGIDAKADLATVLKQIETHKKELASRI